MTDPNLHIIDGNIKDIARNLNRFADIDKNIDNVRREFIGKPEICHKLVAHIIHLRRNTEDYEHREQFWTLLTKYKGVLLKEYDVRWLLSICDTFVDIGNHTQSAIAMNIVQCINRCNLDTSILQHCVDGRLDTNKMAHENKITTWGGMITADIPNGDMIYNMMNRLDMVVSRDPLLNDIWCEIKERSREEEAVVMNHFAKASRHAKQRRFFQ